MMLLIKDMGTFRMKFGLDCGIRIDGCLWWSILVNYLISYVSSRLHMLHPRSLGHKIWIHLV
jgi:hypothetical protein